MRVLMPSWYVNIFDRNITKMKSVSERVGESKVFDSITDIDEFESKIDNLKDSDLKALRIGHIWGKNEKKEGFNRSLGTVDIERENVI